MPQVMQIALAALASIIMLSVSCLEWAQGYIYEK
jgi:hypothetical protein